MADDIEIEKAKWDQEQKRRLYQEQRQSANKESKKQFKIQSPLINQESLLNRGAKAGQEKEEQRQKETEELSRQEEPLGKAGLKETAKAGLPGGPAKVIKQAISAIDQAGGATEISHQAAEIILKTLWANVFTPWFPLTIMGLNVYAFLSSGILDIIFPGMSKKLAPFGICAKILPMGLGKLLGIIALVVLNLILVCLLLIIIVIIYYLIYPAELIKVLPNWKIISKLFSG